MATENWLEVQRGCRIKPANLAHSGCKKEETRTSSASARLQKVRRLLPYDQFLDENLAIYL
jgi:hypothetical protein